MKNIWNGKKLDDLANEYQETQNEQLFEYLFNKLERYLTRYSRNRKIPYEDLLQLERIALWKALKVYNKNKGSICNYTWYFLKREILLYRKENLSISVPIQLLQHNLKYLTEEEDDNICNLYNRKSIDDVVNDMSYTYAEILKDDLNIEEDIVNKLSQDDFYNALYQLRPKEIILFLELFGLKGFNQKSQSELAKKYNVSRQYVSTIITSAKYKLKDIMTDMNLL